MTRPEFDRAFEALTDHPPLHWQWRLYEKFATAEFPPVIDLPTGLGKTMVMAIWLIARAEKSQAIPTRLIYVVDRRTVVDQATDLAEKLVENWKKSNVHCGDPPAISTLRGQLADNREWTRDPSRPAIIIGTVDLIGSALLFSGYRSSYKRRPLEAGLLGQDSLLVLDEAHLSKPFEKLIKSISDFQRTNDKAMRVVCMSATSGTSKSQTFRLTESDLSDSIIDERFKAPKRLTIRRDVDPKKLNGELADAAIEFAKNEELKGKRIVVFVRRPGDAKAIAETIKKHVNEVVDNSGAKPKKTKKLPYSESVEVLTGTMRGLERDELLEKSLVLKRFLNGEEDPNRDESKLPVFLVSTSAGEVGFDLNADHLVGDAAPIDSWIQRLGRVNRRGKGEAQVVLVIASNPADKNDFDKACIATCKLITDGMDVSPKSIAALKASEEWTATDAQGKSSYERACSPEPTMVELTDILVDAWSMTSIIEPMPGRPEVAPWLRGIAEDLPQTTIAWREELDLVKDHPDPAKALQRIFAKHRIRPHETITMNTGQVLEFLKQLAKLKDRPQDLLRTRVALRMTSGAVVLRSIEQLVADPGILFAEATLILPARFGGLDSAGMLNAQSVAKSPTSDDPPLRWLDVADQPGYEIDNGPRHRLRIVIERTDDAWKPQPLVAEAAIPAELNLQASYQTTKQLFDAFIDASYRVRLVQSLAFDEEGEEVRALVILAPLGEKSKKVKQLLIDHVKAVCDAAERIASDLQLDANDPIRSALSFAAKWHDEGKKAEVWQRFARGSTEEGQWLGKMVATRDPKSLKRYRHEFGSMLRIHHVERHGTAGCDLPRDETTRGLALHLIATHHGAGRPHFNDANYSPFTDDERDKLHTESIRRFAKLQRKYGHWHLAWLENLLRCADAMASESVTGSTDDQEDEIEGDPE